MSATFLVVQDLSLALVYPIANFEEFNFSVLCFIYTSFFMFRVSFLCSDVSIRYSAVQYVKVDCVSLT